MILRAANVGWAGTACELAARLQERTMSVGERLTDIEFWMRADAGPGVSAERERLRRLLPVRSLEPSESFRQAEEFDWTDRLGILLAWAFPDRIGQKRTDDGDGLTYKRSSGRGCRLDGEPSRFRRPWLVVADADDRGADAVIRLAGELSERAFRFACGADFETCDVVEWDDRLQQMRALRQTKFAHLVLSEQPLTGKRSPEQLRQAWLSALRVRGLGLLEWDRTATQLLERMRTFAYFFPEADGLDWSEAGLLASAADWLGDALSACRTVNELKKINVGEALRHMVQYSQWREQWRSFEQSLPTHWIVPSGSRIAIDYSDPQAPVLAVRLQELFGLRQSPRLADGRIPLVLHLLSPARRPIQVTRDLESFWRNTYLEVRKELRGRYPKHVWPEDPYQAAPTARAKPRNSG
jgi:ATP-dependent helicase HrpB